MREMRGGGGKYDIYLVYFDDVAKFKDSATEDIWQNYMSDSFSNRSSSLVGVLFYNPTDKKFYFFGYSNFYVPSVCENVKYTMNGDKDKKWRDNITEGINKNYDEMIPVSLVKSLLAPTSDKTPIEEWMKWLNGDSITRTLYRPDGSISFNRYLTFSDGKLKYTTKDYHSKYDSKVLYTCTDKQQSLSLPSTMLSSLTAEQPEDIDIGHDPSFLDLSFLKTIKCRITKRALLFYKLPDTYKTEYDPTPGWMKTDSTPLETAYRLISALKTAKLQSPNPESTPVLEAYRDDTIFKKIINQTWLAPTTTLFTPDR